VWATPSTTADNDYQINYTLNITYKSIFVLKAYKKFNPKYIFCNTQRCFIKMFFYSKTWKAINAINCILYITNAI